MKSILDDKLGKKIIAIEYEKGDCLNEIESIILSFDDGTSVIISHEAPYAEASWLTIEGNN